MDLRTGKPQNGQQERKTVNGHSLEIAAGQLRIAAETRQVSTSNNSDNKESILKSEVV